MLGRRAGGKGSYFWNRELVQWALAEMRLDLFGSPRESFQKWLVESHCYLALSEVPEL